MRTRKPSAKTMVLKFDLSRKIQIVRLYIINVLLSVILKNNLHMIFETKFSLHKSKPQQTGVHIYPNLIKIMNLRFFSMYSLFLHHIQMGQISPVASHRWGRLLLEVRDQRAEIQPSKL